MFRVLFLCTGKSGRSRMAAAIASRVAPKTVEIIGASDKHHLLHEETLKVMEEIQIKMPARIEYSLEEVRNQNFDIVVTLCNKIREMCPSFPGSPAKIHWPLPDPSTTDKADNITDIYRSVRDEIYRRVNSLFKHGFLDSIREMRLTFGTLLNNLTDGVMAHDKDRIIFYMNDAAERITGYNRAETIGKDCHLVFLNRFCGGDCSFCNDKEMTLTKENYPVVFHRKSGEQRNLEMTVIGLNPEHNAVNGALIVFRDVSEIVHLRRRLEQSRGYGGIIGRHISMQRVFDSIRELSDVMVPILIQGETGTGKELVATALHQMSKRASGPFVPVNCGALPEGTLESELFGHVKGAFTGALRDRKGRFELAEGGTIFLDEIGEITQTMQVKLLRVIQEKYFVPVGGEKAVKCDVRIICATNRNLKALTQQGLFREDLYYRLAVIPVSLPSLNERKADIALLAEHFLDKYSSDIGKRVREISPEALDILNNYSWPGNVRELSNAIQYAMIKCNTGAGIIEPEHLPVEILDFGSRPYKSKPGRPPKSDEDIVRETLTKTGGNKAKAAKILNISRTTLYRLMK